VITLLSVRFVRRSPSSQISIKQNSFLISVYDSKIFTWPINPAEIDSDLSGALSKELCVDAKNIHRFYVKFEDGIILKGGCKPELQENDRNV
jgi:hypothetical protein